MKCPLKKGDICLVILAILVSGIALWFLKTEKNGDYVTVSVDGDKKRYNINEELIIPVYKQGKEVNQIEIKEGKVKMKYANCPDQLCVKHNEIMRDGETIICLPNNVVIQVTSKIDREIDN